ncbi:MAG TPA: glycosyltransferase family 1 protein [Flavisolibacter sp.]
MQIGIEAQRIFRPRKHGMDVVAIELIKNLQEIDGDNDYTIFGRSGVNDVLPPAPNYHVDTFSAMTYADWEQVALPRRLKQLKLDLLHCTANTAPLYLTVPLVVTIHDIIYLEQVDFKGSGYQNLGNLYRRFIVPSIAKKARLILTVSEFERENIINTLHLPADKVKVLYNGVAPQFNNQYTPGAVEEFRKKYHLPSEFIMFLGNTAPKKNTLNVIKAYADYCIQSKQPVPMVLLDYRKEFVEKILNDLGQPALLSLFVFPGYVPYAQIPLMYNAATLFLYPSLRESFGLPILEAMACGVPVITSNTSSMPEVAGDAAEIIDPFNHKDLSQSILNLLGNEELRSQYRQKGLARARRFTWRKSAEELLKIYETI